MLAVGQLINTFSSGGAELIAYKIAMSMTKRYESHVLALSTIEADLEKRITAQLNAAGVKTYSIHKRPHRDLLRGVLACKKYIKQNNLGIMHTHCESPDIIGRLASLGLGVRVISTLHTHFPWPQRRMVGWLVERFLQFRTSWLVECSPGMERAWRYLGYPQSKVVCIRNGIDPEKFRLDSMEAKRVWRKTLELPESARLVVSVGRVARQKGHDVLIKSFCRIQEKNPAAYLVIAGGHNTEPEFYRYVKSLVKENGLVERILFIGESNQVHSLMAAADLIVLPSRWEGLSLAFLEALAAGKPLISTRITPHLDVLPEELQTNLVPPDDVEALSKILDKVLHNVQSQALQGELGRKLVEEHYSERRMLNNYHSIYEQVLNSCRNANKRNRA